MCTERDPHTHAHQCLVRQQYIIAQYSAPNEACSVKPCEWMSADYQPKLLHTPGPASVFAHTLGLIALSECVSKGLGQLLD